MMAPAEDRKELVDAWLMHAEEIRARLKEFRAVPSERYVQELCYCLMTPQSSAAQCALVAAELERLRFLEKGFDPAPLLRSFNGGYVRFHNVKARRLLAVHERAEELRELLGTQIPDKELRDMLVDAVDGLGMKEASHVLRNIGRGGVTIVDRHILRNMIRLGILASWPASISRGRYLDIEQRFEDLAQQIGIPHDELDLLLWRRETGFILK